MSDTGDVTLGVLSLHNSKESKAILNAADDLGFGTAWLRGETLAVDVADGAATLEPDVDVVVNRLLLSRLLHNSAKHVDDEAVKKAVQRCSGEI